MRSKKSPDYKLKIRFHVSGTISENRDERTFNLDEDIRPTESFGFDITFDNSNGSMINHQRERLGKGINRAAKLNDDLLAILYKEECE